ncbi:hypothetical protein X797_004614 [Metarhizium robertsii]|uniref:Uncharacterized protein n=2 Tax=Metarhizium robertsii TaxID=568076 RepID=E9ESU8_METRA|nr:uncharacterized protein MAA_03200 [Metarhizium robertsii ARSEF 23]EFZ01971.1 hypothetical protein MAA_03200 [Metarhizium robertsii ARSEF 23]EXV02482.1 hypothetical protein X797_004614 [Metarhizium robertsii]
MASIKSSLLLASLASLSLATPVREKQSPRAQLLPYYLGKPHKWPSLQCAATGQWGRVLDEKICGTWYFCHYTVLATARDYDLGHDQSYRTFDACLKDREPAPDGQEGSERLQESLVPYMERAVHSDDPCVAYSLARPQSAMFWCSTDQYCKENVEQGRKTLDECLALFEKRPVGPEHPEDPKSDTQLFQGEDDSEPMPVWT